MKQILLIGDSIREGYCEQVKELFKDEYEVIFPVENCRSSQAIIFSLHNWVTLTNPEDVEFVHVNCGQWDVGHIYSDKHRLTSIREYKRNIGYIIRVLRKLFVNAKIIFATTTPMNPALKIEIEKALKIPNLPLVLHPRTTKEVIKYNTVMKKVAKKNNIILNDLYELTKDWDGSRYIDVVHYTKESSDILANHIVNLIKSL